MKILSKFQVHRFQTRRHAPPIGNTLEGSISGLRSPAFLGFILDPRYSGAEDSEILKHLMSEMKSEGDSMEFLQNTNADGGRKILVTNNEG